MRWAMGVEYDGSRYHGWQIQDGVESVQGVLEQAIANVANHPVRVYCAGRTDTGVHGLGQVVHFETDAERTTRSWILGTNVNLPGDVNVNWVERVSSDFHARFSAVSRRYRYVILNRMTRSAVWRERAVWIHRPLDEVLMQQAAVDLVGTHDFSSYRALACQAKSPVRTVKSLTVTREADRIVIDIEANAFLHHMVRNIAGVLMAIGAGDHPVSWAKEVLAYRDRTLGGVTAPPQGLFFVSVGYPPAFDLPENPPV